MQLSFFLSSFEMISITLISSFIISISIWIQYSISAFTGVAPKTSPGFIPPGIAISASLG